MAEPDRLKCPYYNQVRFLAFHNKAAKGPGYSRVMTRKILANEEYCMQIDAHTQFNKGWDTLVKNEWKATNNEFAVISNVPAGFAEMEIKNIGGEKEKEVPRQCLVRFADNGIPVCNFISFVFLCFYYTSSQDIFIQIVICEKKKNLCCISNRFVVMFFLLQNYESPGDGKVMDLEKPLLANTWSAAFSFAKCHFEESVPYDPYTPYVMGAEQFPRFVRMWTRG